jgi:hypothetical protein
MNGAPGNRKKPLLRRLKGMDLLLGAIALALILGAVALWIIVVIGKS